MLTFDANVSFVRCRLTPLTSRMCVDDFISLVEHGW